VAGLRWERVVPWAHTGARGRLAAHLRGEALFAAALGSLVARPLTTAVGRRRAALAILGAWIGEFLVLFLAGRLLAGELVPEVAWFYWLIGTGGPLQPVAALVGMWLAGRGRRTPQAPMAESRSIPPS